VKTYFTVDEDDFTTLLFTKSEDNLHESAYKLL
jgi:hypothetical protein